MPILNLERKVRSMHMILKVTCILWWITRVRVTMPKIPQGKIFIAVKSWLASRARAVGLGNPGPESQLSDPGHRQHNNAEDQTCPKVCSERPWYSTGQGDEARCTS